MSGHRLPGCVKTSVTYIRKKDYDVLRNFNCEENISMEEELRKQAVQRHLAGESPKAVYTSLDRSKKWFFKWLNRYQSGAEDWYQERSRAPLTRPSELSTADKELITSTRKRLDSSPFAQIGVSAIKWELHKLGVPFCSDSTINRTLKREGLVKKNTIFPHRG